MATTAARPARRQLPVWWFPLMFLGHMLFWQAHIITTQGDWMIWLWLLVPVYPMWVDWSPGDERDQVDRGGLAGPEGSRAGDQSRA